MGRFLRLVAGRQVSFDESSAPAIYEERLTVVPGAPIDSNQITGPVSGGTSLTLPQSGTYVGLELEVFYNGKRIKYGSLDDYVYVGAGTKTQIQLNFDIDIGDAIDFVKHRNL